MRLQDINYLVSILLVFSISVTALLGYIQAQLELRGFIPHRYFAYLTLMLAAVHVYLNIGKIVNYLRKRFTKK